MRTHSEDGNCPMFIIHRLLLEQTMCFDHLAHFHIDPSINPPYLYTASRGLSIYICMVVNTHPKTWKGPSTSLEL